MIVKILNLKNYNIEEALGIAVHTAKKQTGIQPHYIRLNATQYTRLVHSMGELLPREVRNFEWLGFTRNWLIEDNFYLLLTSPINDLGNEGHIVDEQGEVILKVTLRT